MPAFQYTPFRSSQIGTIGDLMLRPAQIEAQRSMAVADAQARAAAASGDIWGRTFQNVAQTVANLPAQMQQQKINAQELAYRDQELKDRAADQARAKADAQTLATALPKGRVAALASLEGNPDLYAKAQKHFDAIDTNQRRLMGSVAAGVREFGDSPDAALAALDDLVEQGYDGKRLTPLRLAIVQRPEMISGIVDELLKQSPDEAHRALVRKPAEPVKLTERDPTKDLINPQTGAVVVKGTPPPPKPEPPAKEYEVTVPGPGGRPVKKLVTADELRKGVGEYRAPQANAGDTGPEPLPADPASQNILSQTGLSINAFRYLTGQAGQLARDKVTREKAAREAETWARKNNVDISTLPAQYKSFNDVLAANIARLNNTKIMEQELVGTVQNLQGVVNDKDLGRLKFANVAKIWLGQEVNDELAQQYAIHLSQLRNELSAYYAATQGRSGNNITLDDKREAETVIKNGIAAGGLAGMMKAVENSTAKMGTVMQGSVDRSQQAVWNLFGVGKNYKPKTDTGGGALKEGTEGVVNGVPAVWKTVNGKTGWYAK